MTLKMKADGSFNKKWLLSLFLTLLILLFELFVPYIRIYYFATLRPVYRIVLITASILLVYSASYLIINLSEEYRKWKMEMKLDSALDVIRHIMRYRSNLSSVFYISTAVFFATIIFSTCLYSFFPEHDRQLKNDLQLCEQMKSLACINWWSTGSWSYAELKPGYNILFIPSVGCQDLGVENPDIEYCDEFVRNSIIMNDSKSNYSRCSNDIIRSTWDTSYERELDFC